MSTNVNYSRTLGSCIKAHIERNVTKDVLFISLSRKANALSIVHFVCIEILCGGKTLLGDGVATLLSANGGAFIRDAVNDASSNLKIPLPANKVPKGINTLVLYFISRGRRVIKTLPIDEQ